MSVIVLLLAGCGGRTTAAPWAEQLQAANAAATEQDPTAELSDIRVVGMSVKDTLVPATIPVMMTFKTSASTTTAFTYRSGNPDGTIDVFSSGTGDPAPALPPATLAAIQRSPAEVIQSTWEAGRRYVAQVSTEPALNAVDVRLVTDPAALPPQVQGGVAWKVKYTAMNPSPEHAIVFWVDPSTGDILFQEEGITP
jgi:hypothetical protein